jgi:Glycine transporter
MKLGIGTTGHGTPAIGRRRSLPSRIIQHRLDLLGIAVIAAATAIGGGTTRDVLLNRQCGGRLVVEAPALAPCSGATTSGAGGH